MKYLLYKSVKHKKRFLAVELRYYRYKAILTSCLLDIKTKYKVAAKLSKLGSGRIKLKRRCIVSGFSKSYRKFLLSRICFRELASFGNLIGIKKSS